MNYSTIDYWDLHSPVKLEQREFQLAPEINTKLELRFDEIKFFADNIITIQMAFRTMFFPSQLIEMVQMFSQSRFAIKTRNTYSTDDILNDEFLNIIAELYEKEIPKCFAEISKGYTEITKDYSLSHHGSINRIDSLNSIKTAIKSYFKVN